MTRKIRKILIANRGEIAVRIMRTCREMGIACVAVYSDPDRTALHVLSADEAYPLAGSKASETYLNQTAILEHASRSGCDAIHPGYGFLSENADFADAVTAANLCFIGPSAKAIRLLGDKVSARELAATLGIPTALGSNGPVESEARAREIAVKIGLPVLLKASAGGGGKGMRVVERIEEFSQAYAMARSEAGKAFGDDRIYIEQCIHNPHHVEIQILGDEYGSVVFLGERDCSIQRRHQKVIEESPSPVINAQIRERMGKAAVQLATRAGYSNAGTVEFLVNDRQEFFFLEVNTRLQVEHPVTETVTGIDLVRAQILVAQGETLPFTQSEIRLQGHAIECRVYAEDPDNQFFPSTGLLERYVLPSGPRVRVDNGARQGETVQIYYDPMLAKVITWGPSRNEAIATMRRALREFEIAGIQTTIPFCEYVLQHSIFLQGGHGTDFTKQHFNADGLRKNGRDINRSVVSLAAVLVVLEGKEELNHHSNTGAHPSSRWKGRRGEAFQ